MPDIPFTGSLKPGVTLGKYEVREQLAVGGMAIIYKAYDPTLDRSVAIKQIAPHLAQDERFLARFRTEAQTLAKLSATQPNIVNVIELIQQDGQLFLVMEYVEGTTLRAMMDRGPVPLQTGLGILLSTALGLKAMHAQGIIHRDLSPANIMLAKDGALKITDFGLIGHSGGKTSLPMGTTKYMAPEMFAGMPVDGRADLYSLGMIGYEMFAGPDKFAAAFKDVLRDERAQQVRWMHWHSNPTLKAPSLRDLQPGLPPLVVKIIERLMEKDPSKRFASADQVVKWLRRIFVMHVQGKSLSVTDSESIEREMDADTAATGPTVKPAAVAAGATPQPAETGEKTAPLPVPTWTWKRAAFWAAVVLTPLVLTAAALLTWKHYTVAERSRMATEIRNLGDDQFKNKDYTGADETYTKLVRDFQDLREFAVYGKQHALMARAEAALSRKDWDSADANAMRAQKDGAPAEWYNDFRNRFQKQQDIEQVKKMAEAAQAAGDLPKAIAYLTDLQNKYPELNLGETISELSERIQLTEYRKLIEEGRQQLAKRNLDLALKFFADAKAIRDLPEVADLIQETTLEKEVAGLYAQAEKAVAGGKWADAVRYYEEMLKKKPSEAVRVKMNNAKAEELAAQAKLLEQNGLVKEAMEIWAKVIPLNPNHPDAVAAMNRASRQEKLDSLVKAGEEAMRAQQWDSAISNLRQAIPLLETKDADLKTRIEGLIAEASYRKPYDGALEALGRDDFEKALALVAEAQAVKDTEEIKSLQARIEKRKAYVEKRNLGKELVAQVKYAQAVTELEKARKIDDTEEIRTLLRDVNYMRNLAMGKSYRNDNKLREALAYFKLARGFKDTPEIQALIDLTQRELETPKKSE